MFFKSQYSDNMEMMSCAGHLDEKITKEDNKVLLFPFWGKSYEYKILLVAYLRASLQLQPVFLQPQLLA